MYPSNIIRHRVDQGVLASLYRIRQRIDVAIEEYESANKPLYHAEHNLRQSMEAMKMVRKTILHSPDY